MLNSHHLSTPYHLAWYWKNTYVILQEFTVPATFALQAERKTPSVGAYQNNALRLSSLLPDSSRHRWYKFHSLPCTVILVLADSRVTWPAWGYNAMWLTAQQMLGSLEAHGIDRPNRRSSAGTERVSSLWTRPETGAVCAPGAAVTRERWTRMARAWAVIENCMVADVILWNTKVCRRVVWRVWCRDVFWLSKKWLHTRPFILFNLFK